MNISDSSRKLISFAMIIMIIVSLSFLFLIVTPAFADSWLSGWSYRKALVIAHTGDGAQTNYQMKLLVGESSGSGTNNVNLGGHGLSSFNDLRFTTSDGSTLCDYWIESKTGTTPSQVATVWIEVPSIAAHPADTTIYMYYGNAGASSVSSIVNTFVFADNFDTLDGGVWDHQSGNVRVNSGNLELVYTGDLRSYVSHSMTLNTNYRVKYRAKYVVGGDGRGQIDMYSTTDGNFLTESSRIIWASTSEFTVAYHHYIYTTNYDGYDSGHEMSSDVFYLKEALVLGTSYTFKQYQDGSSVAEASCSSSLGVTTTRSHLGFHSYPSGKGVVDWVFVAKYTTTEPTWSSFEGETSLTMSTVTTQSASSIAITSIVGNGNITTTGTPSPTRRGFCYMTGTSGDPTIANSVVYTDNTSFGTGAFSQSILGLSAGTSYRMRAYAVNSAGTSYGTTVSATTLTGIASLTTQSCTDVITSSLIANGTITTLNGADNVTTRRGFVYVEGSSGNPVIGESGTDVVYEDGDFEIGSFQLSISNLFPGRTYTVRPYAVTIYGVGYGMSVTVTTLGSSSTISRETQVTIIVNPMYIAIENSESSWMISTVSENSTYWWTSDNRTPSEPFEENQMKSIVTCVGSVAVDVFLRSHNFTGGVGWTLSDNMTELNTVDNVIVLSVGASGYSEETMLVLTNDDSQSFISNLSPDEFVKWCMRLKTGLFSDAEDKTGVVTLTAVAH